jgi:RNA polymerase sigma-70 factor (ECF subfamily)
LCHPAAGPAEAFAGRDAARILHELLSRLPEGERLVLELALFEEMPYADIATALLIPEGTVKSRVHHALRKLRAWSRGQGDLVA